MGESKYHKSDIAKKQLETAVYLFLNRFEFSSTITLASAAGNILNRMVILEGKEPFVDYSRRVYTGMNGVTPKRKSYSHHIDKTLGATTHKHMSLNDPLTVEIDLQKSAADSLIKALSDYIKIYGNKEDFVKAFFKWTWLNMDGEELLEQYKSLPKGLKP